MRLEGGSETSDGGGLGNEDMAMDEDESEGNNGERNKGSTIDEDDNEDEDNSDNADKWIYAVIRSVKVDKPDTFGTVYYTATGGIEVVDLNTIQCVVGRIHIDKHWAIIDRSGELAQLKFG